MVMMVVMMMMMLMMMRLMCIGSEMMLTVVLVLLLWMLMPVVLLVRHMILVTLRPSLHLTSIFSKPAFSGLRNTALKSCQFTRDLGDSSTFHLIALSLIPAFAHIPAHCLRTLNPKPP